VASGVESGRSTADNIPSPDPSLLTTGRLEEAKIDIRRELAAAISAMSAEVSHLKELHESKFDGVRSTLSERAAQSVRDQAMAAAQAAQDRATIALGVDNAFKSQKEAAALLDAARAREIETLRALITTSSSVATTEIKSVTGRLDRGEGESGHRSDNQTKMLAVAALILSFVVCMIGVVALMEKSVTPVAQASGPVK